MPLQGTIEEMKRVFADLPHGIRHTLRVLENAERIMDGETITGEIREIVALAAVLHDIGAVEAQRKHGNMHGRYQEIEGPAIAQAILERAGASNTATRRVCHIVGNHHTPENIDGPDFQVLWEADYLEYLQFGEKSRDPDVLRQRVSENFRTVTGRALALERLDL
jgi:urease accessory protein UreE